MEVLFVARGKKSNNAANPGTVVFNQAKSLKRYGVNVSFYLITGGGPFSYLYSIIPLCKKLKLNRYDIIHSHYSLSSFIVTLARFFSGQNKKPQVVSLMGSDTKLAGLNAKLIQIFCKHNWSATIVKTAFMSEGLTSGKTHIIPNGVDLEAVKHVSEYKENKDKKVILFAANPSRESKNFKLAERACSLINGINFTLRVVFNVSHEQIIYEINNADILLSTSKWEGSPNVIKEAMACNCPVVATNVGDISWLFGNEPGYYLTSFEPEDIAVKIREAVKYAHFFGRTNGRERIIKLGLDAGSIANRIITVYKSVLVNGK